MAMPIAPPTAAITADSTRNCIRMSRLRAPSDLRTPISRVRSVTLASITFMITTPPMTRNTETTPTMVLATAPVRFVHKPIIVSDARMPKLSSAMGSRWRRPRIMVRASSSVSRIHSGAAPLDVDGHIQSLPVFAIVFQERPDRDVDKIVLGLPEDGSNRLGYADHQEAAAIDVNRLADGVDRGEQLAGDL